MTGLRGQRLYLLVMDGRDIERAGAVLTQRLWLAGFGYIKINSYGSLLERTILDASVWQSNRLDFAAGAKCLPPLEQQRGDPVLFPGELEFADTRIFIPGLSPDERETTTAKIRTAKLAPEVIEEAAKKREEWLQRKVDIVIGSGAAPEAKEAARDRAEKALDGGILSGDYLIVLVQDGRRVSVTVQAILDNPGKYDGALTLDPLEPDYQGGKTVGKLYTFGSAASLHSFAFGGRTFTLERQLARIEVQKGKITEATETTLELLRESPNFFDLGEVLVVLDRGALLALDEHSLAHHVGGHVQFYREKTRTGVVVDELIDPPTSVIRRILSLGASRRLKPLEAVITTPTIRRNGTVLDKPGYDPQTRLFLALPVGVPKVPDAPTSKEIRDALDALMVAFKGFPFVTAVDRGVLLSALFAAVVRAVLPTAPGFAFDAPTQGAGKTLLARAIGALCTGGDPAVMPPALGEEVRKRILAMLRAGELCVIWDNVKDALDDASLAAALTSGSITDRVLGLSKVVTVPNRALFMFTGNNLELSGDMPRRVLRCRIDPGEADVLEREFDLDPVQHVLKYRQVLAVAVLTIIRGWICAGKPRASGTMASFEDFDFLVRQPVAWVASYASSEAHADPLDAVRRERAVDPERDALAAFLRAFYGLFGSAPVYTNAIHQGLAIEHERRSGPRLIAIEFESALVSLCGKRAIESALMLGQALAKVRGRNVDGMRLEGVTDAHRKIKRWKLTGTGISDNDNLAEASSDADDVM